MNPTKLAPLGNHERRRRWAAWLVAATACLALAACGGGGSGSSNDGSGVDLSKLALVKVTVKDDFGAPIAGAAIDGAAKTEHTDTNGAALVSLDQPDLSTTLKVSRESFVDGSVATSAKRGQVKELQVVLKRATAPAGASLATRSGVPPSVDDTRRQLTFEIELVLVDGNAKPIENLEAAHFELLACTPSAIAERADCVRGDGPADDKAYEPLPGAPAELTHVAGEPARPYAAALLMDQSGSIRDSDPTGARLYSAKAFMQSLGAEDRALLAAFASGGALAEPLTVYGSFRDAASAPDYFATLDSLGSLVGGRTPLYDSLDDLRADVAADTALPADLRRAVVLFTDGSDTDCAAACRERRARSIQGAKESDVRLFTIGLSGNVDVATLGELAHQTGGAFLYAESAEQLLPLYGSLGKLLSLSLPTYRLQWTVQADAFTSGHTLLGKVRVNTGTGSIDVPFLIRIP